MLLTEAMSLMMESIEQVGASANLMKQDHTLLLQRCQLLEQESREMKQTHTMIVDDLVTRFRQLELDHSLLVKKIQADPTYQPMILADIRRHREQMSLADFLRWVWKTYPPPRPTNEPSQYDDRKLLSVARLCYHPDKIGNIFAGYQSICQEVTKMMYRDQ